MEINGVGKFDLSTSTKEIKLWAIQACAVKRHICIRFVVIICILQMFFILISEEVGLFSLTIKQISYWSWLMRWCTSITASLASEKLCSYCTATLSGSGWLTRNIQPLKRLLFYPDGHPRKSKCSLVNWQMTCMIFWIMVNVIWFREFCSWMSYLEYEL